MTSTWPLSGVKGKAIHATVTILAIAVSVVAITDLRANVLMERGISQIRAGAYAIGESNLQRSLKLDFAPRQTYYYLAIAQIKSGRLEEAEVNLEKCMSRFVDEGVYLAYAELEANRGETLKAQAAVDVLLQGRPSPAVEQQAHYIESLIAIQRHEYDRAVQILEALTQAGPSHEAGLVALGQLYAAAGLTNSARQSFEAALRLIDQALEDAGAPWAPGVPSSNSSKTSQQQDLELLRRQREYVIDQLENLL
jgi:tetratricopeptide (TPR) repeat protein